ncbi:MAG: response regulator [Candidatus Blackburnbacteria bacterium]|nr:response regulator [Candidatus Blackburnbacteria bacterium]
MLKILVVDDDEGILEAIRAVFEYTGFEVHTIIDAEEAFQKAKDISPDIMLLDLLLAGKNGRDVIKQFKKNKSTKNLPIIMISAHPGAEEIAKKNGANDFLAKPFDIDQLLTKIKKHTRKPTPLKHH